MFENILGRSAAMADLPEPEEITYQNKRAYARRTADRCISEVDGQNYPVQDWSMGGLRVFGDFRTYALGQQLPVTMKFKLRDQIVAIQHMGTIVRKTADTIGMQFAPLTKDIRTNLQQVVDDFNANEFAESQA